jgi:hypothetical protein
MITVSAAQMQMLEESAFQARLRLVLAEHFPTRTTALGPEFPQSVAAGTARARGHGFETLDDISKYVMIEFALHPAFDQDPAFPWAAELLAASDIPTPTMRMHLLLDRALDALRPPATGAIKDDTDQPAAGPAETVSGV